MTSRGFGALDIVVNNAGFGSIAPVEDVTDEDFRSQIDTNLYGVLNVTRGRRSGTGLTGRDLRGYVAAQVAGAIAGSVLANLMFDLTAVDFSAKDRAAGHLWLGEVVATTGLILLVFALARSGRAPVAPAAVGAYIGAAYWFTSSTSFANPAVTIGRAFTDTVAGMAPASVPGFVIAQLVGLAAGVGLLAALYPDAGKAADQVVVPADDRDPALDHRP